MEPIVLRLMFPLVQSCWENVLRIFFRAHMQPASTSCVHWIALTRAVSPSIEKCELVHLERQSIDYQRAHEQHGEYVQALLKHNTGHAGHRNNDFRLKLVKLPASATAADSVFVEDPLLAFDECAVLTRPGAESRRVETDMIRDDIAKFRKHVDSLEAPATLDGGDVLTVTDDGNKNVVVLVGTSTRSNEEGISQLQAILDKRAPGRYRVVGVKLEGALHLKSAVTQVAPSLLLINPSWVSASELREAVGGELGKQLKFVQVDPSEPSAANILSVGGEFLVFPEAFPKTLERLKAAISAAGHELDIVVVPADELAKAEGAVTCCSVIFREIPEETAPGAFDG